MEALGSCSSKPERSARPRVSAPAVFFTILALVALVVLVAQYALRYADSAVDATSLVSKCAPPSVCWEELQVFLATFRSSVKPCHNFESHVCGHVTWSSEMTRETPDDMRFRWYLQGSRFLDQYKMPAPAMALYRACLDQWDSDVGDEQRVLQFLHERGIPWPATAAGSHHALYVLLDLVINWGIQFWFELSLHRLPRESRYSLSMSYIPTSKHWRRWLNTSRVRGASFKYAWALYDAYGAYSTSSEQIDKLLRDEFELIEMLSDAYLLSNPVVLRLPLRDMALLTPNMSAAMWLSYLNAHLSPYALQPDDRLLLVDTALGRTFNAVFSRFRIARLLELLGLWFVQQVSFALSRKASLAVYGGMDAVRRYRGAHCYSFAESRFRELLQFKRAAAIAAQSRSVGVAVTDVFVQLQRAAVRLIRAASWLDDRARVEATAIVSRTELMPKMWLSVGTSSQMAVESEVRRYQDAFPSRVTSVFPGWLEAARIHKMTSPSWPLNDSLLHLHGHFSYLVYQSYWCNTLYVQMEVGAPPIFYIAGPHSLNYGGLGFVIARELVEALSAKRGSFLDADRRIRSWMSPSSRKALEKKTACAGSQDALMDIAATKIALEAYRAVSRSGIPGDSVTRSTLRRGIRSGSGVAAVTEDMLFFLATGRSQCGLKPPPLRFLQNVEEFSRVFSCAPGSPMNPPQKCSFFF